MAGREYRCMGWRNSRLCGLRTLRPHSLCWQCARKMRKILEEGGSQWR